MVDNDESNSLETTPHIDLPSENMNGGDSENDEGSFSSSASL